MDAVSVEQIRCFRLHSHHLDRWYGAKDLERVAGVCGFQNTPPGTWGYHLHSRIPEYSQRALKDRLEAEKTLLQAWSVRGVPLVFPTSESAIFLAGLQAQGTEPWIYTRGIALALDALGMKEENLLATLLEVLSGLDSCTIKSKAALDQTLADWMEPFLPSVKVSVWRAPSMYGNPAKQTVGGAVVSFLLRPAALYGKVVFGKRRGLSPTFTSYKNWLGFSMPLDAESEKKLARKFLHAYGPARKSGLLHWLGCSPEQGDRIWKLVEDELFSISFNGKERFILSQDKDTLIEPPVPKRAWHFLAGHDPYLGLQDRTVICPIPEKKQDIWRTVSNPGVLLHRGIVVGTWRGRRSGSFIDYVITLWGKEKNRITETIIEDMAFEHGAFLDLKVRSVRYQ